MQREDETESGLPKRKPTRLKDFDYSTAGAYFITVCTRERKKILSQIVKEQVGVGALDDPSCNPPFVQVRLTRIGKIVEKNLLASEKIAGVKIDQYVIMPDHLHVIFFFDPKGYETRNSGSSRAPTPTNKMLPQTISVFKRFCNKEIGESIFQRGYADHIVRDRDDLETRRKYIYENPLRWYYKNLENE